MYNSSILFIVIFISNIVIILELIKNIHEFNKDHNVALSYIFIANIYYSWIYIVKYSC